jgi:hypothetical protein
VNEKTKFFTNFSKLLILICITIWLRIITGFLTWQAKNPGQGVIALSLFNTFPVRSPESLVL